MKICRTCKTNKDLREFYKHPATRDKFFSECIRCIRKKRTKGELCESCGNKKSHSVCKTCLLASNLKRCFRCKNILSTDQFWKDQSRKDGLKPSCKNCLKNGMPPKI